MKRLMTFLVVAAVTAAVAASAPQPRDLVKEVPNVTNASPYESALGTGGNAKKVKMACQNRACNDPETCGIFTLGSKCTSSGGGCEELPCD